jgi:hypothetical protein
VTVTAGATQAIFTAIAAFVRPGDEVIVFEPVYDSYVPAIETVGGKAVFAQLQFPDYAPDWAQVAQLITPRTRMIIVNSPHNPTGSLLTAADLDQLAELVRGTDIVVLSDEVYEHILFDGERHASAVRPCRAGAAQHRRLQLRQDLSHHRLENRLCRRPGGADGRVPQGASVQCVHCAYAVAIGAGRIHAGCFAPSRPGRLLSGKARFLPQSAGSNAI